MSGGRQAYNAEDMSRLEPSNGTTTALTHAVDPGFTGSVCTFAPGAGNQSTPPEIGARRW